ncbi:TetR/AcrR family transcriptional regulator [Nocardia rhizosphaerihabitans]|uniref:TetR family transcriptional regulator n=1 Tax=Nocardia rhizosphaerihabitans TaxID=1691570 RepID=A0ABQ2K610_9NOCA|nr:TetR/AcrR family transcriptional regulator [Nocardia rhizosphaerihabitans]GGN70001.1 TetR family transcriptional regulator [Nocardia rhizosphaerihabitans]
MPTDGVEKATEQATQILELLWRHALPAKPGARGPKPGLTVDAVVDAGIALADREGIEKLTIRAVAAELGLRAMSLYTYVPSKDALLVLMVDAVAADDPAIPADLPIRDRMIAIATRIRTELIAHPWLLEVSPWRQVLGPARMRRYENQLRAISDAGLTDLAMDRAIAVLTDFATGNARLAVAAAGATAQLSDADWWQVHGPLLAEVMPAADFPLAGRVGTAVGEHYQAPADPDGAFAYGVATLVDGILADAGD